MKNSQTLRSHLAPHVGFMLLTLMFLIGQHALKAQCFKSKSYRAFRVVEHEVVPLTTLNHNGNNGTTHSFFQDRYSYYDVSKKAYVFWEAGQVSYVPATQPFLDNATLKRLVKRERIDLTGGLNLDLHPYRSYPRMMKMYPVDSTRNNLSFVPQPVSGKPY